MAVRLPKSLGCNVLRMQTFTVAENSMTDEEFVADLEACLLPESSFNHIARVRLGYLSLKKHGIPEAAFRVSSAIKKYANSLGKSSLYHETITVAFLALIHAHLADRGDAGGWNAFKEHNPELLRKDALQAYYPGHCSNLPLRGRASCWCRFLPAVA